LATRKNFSEFPVCIGMRDAIMAETHYLTDMASTSLEIRTPKDLVQALEKAKKIEEAFEEVLNWRGFLTVADPEIGNLLGSLVHDSATHESMVDTLIKMVEPFASTRRETRSAPIVIDGDDEVQFLKRLLEGEEMAYYVYSTILEAMVHLDPQSFGGERNATEMRRVLGQLVSAERRHRGLVSQLLATRNPP
jgi:rubrerythrin